MIRTTQEEQLDAWLEQTSASGCPKLVSLATGITCDYAAVAAALRVLCSTGPMAISIA